MYIYIYIYIYDFENEISAMLTFSRPLLRDCTPCTTACISSCMSFSSVVTAHTSQQCSVPTSSRVSLLKYSRSTWRWHFPAMWASTNLFVVTHIHISSMWICTVSVLVKLYKMKHTSKILEKLEKCLVLVTLSLLPNKWHVECLTPGRTQLLQKERDSYVHGMPSLVVNIEISQKTVFIVQV